MVGANEVCLCMYVTPMEIPFILSLLLCCLISESLGQKINYFQGQKLKKGNINFNMCVKKHFIKCMFIFIKCLV